MGKVPVTYKRTDFQTDQEVKWCPGCGDYTILASVQNFMAELGIAKENGYSLELFASNLLNDRNYVSAAQNTLLDPFFSVARATDGFGYINAALPEGRIVGVKAGFEF